MSIVVLLAVVVLLLGLALWYMAKNPKTQEMGKLMFFCGLLAFLLGASTRGCHFGIDGIGNDDGRYERR
jgi:riboflavin transporter FmnP